MTDNTQDQPAAQRFTDSSASDITTHDRMRGCLLAGAVGDALGAPIEFMRHAEICQTFGPDGINDYVPYAGRLGAITDDTQMTLFTAEGMLRSYVRESLRGLCSPASVVSHAYLRWLLTQGFAPKKQVDTSSWLLGLPELHRRRAPGNTCLSALRSMGAFTADKAQNNSKGAGGIMRVAPVAMMFYEQPEAVETVFRLGKETAWITHGHPSGHFSAAAFAVILHALLCGESIEDGIGRAQDMLRAHVETIETLRALTLGIELAHQSLPPSKAIPQIGEGWVGEEALGIAIYCALTATDLVHGIRISVNHSGDSDTTGILVGQLLGAQFGESAIPERWLSPLELRDAITEMADDLFQHRNWNLDPYDYDEAIVQRYPGH